MTAPTKSTFNWLTIVAGVFITCLIVSNIIAVKLVTIFGLVLPAAVVIFPISYIFGDVLTEVYGYRQARRVIWLGFLCNLLAVIAIWLGQILPGVVPPVQDAYAAVLGFTPRVLAASFVAYLVGEFANSYVLARLKVTTAGRWLWLRTISSTLIGEGLDSAVFMTAAFLGSGLIPDAALPGAIVAQWLFKTAYEVLATPLTYAIVSFLKRQEGVDVYDRDTNFNPLALAEE
jgi:uncharacterized integral membrane protein (TIGR00697 family)